MNIREAQFATEGFSATASVMTEPVEDCSGDSGCRHYATIEWTTREGMTFTKNRENVGSSRDKGDQYTILYLASNPGEIHTTGNFSFFAWVAMVGGVIVVVMGLLGLLLQKRTE